MDSLITFWNKRGEQFNGARGSRDTDDAQELLVPQLGRALRTSAETSVPTGTHVSDTAVWET